MRCQFRTGRANPPRPEEIDGAASELAKVDLLAKHSTTAFQ
jgi:hypothetical protein